MICECGGVLQPVLLEAFDMSGFVGHPVPTIRTPGYRCDKCTGETVDGHIVNAYVRSSAWALLKLIRLLSKSLIW